MAQCVDMVEYPLLIGNNILGEDWITLDLLANPHKYDKEPSRRSTVDYDLPYLQDLLTLIFGMGPGILAVYRSIHEPAKRLINWLKTRSSRSLTQPLLSCEPTTTETPHEFAPREEPNTTHGVPIAPCIWCRSTDHTSDTCLSRYSKTSLFADSDSDDEENHMRRVRTIL